MENSDKDIFEIRINELYEYYKKRSIEQFNDIKVLDLLNLNERPKHTGDHFNDMMIEQIYNIIECDETLQSLTIGKFFENEEKFKIQEDQYAMITMIRDMSLSVYEKYRSDEDEIKDIICKIEHSIDYKFDDEDIAKLIEFLDYFFMYDH